ncbi:MAG: FG-GAP repeat protein [Marinicellaceae bacterium]
MLNLKLLTLIFLFFVSTIEANVAFDKKRPQGTTDEQWLSLKAVVQETILLPPNSLRSQDSYFGNSVSVHNNTAIIGVPGVTGSGATGPGTVHILEFDGTKWNNTYLLMADDGEVGDRFGTSVSISGDWAAIGANGDDIGNSVDRGSVYLFKKTSINGQTRWNQYDKLSGTSTGDFFGNSVSVFAPNGAGRLVIGAPKNDEIEPNAGSIYIYKLISSVWTQVDHFTATDANQNDEFGVSVSLYNNLIVVGADGNDDNGSFSGSAYIYKLNPVSQIWQYKIKLLADDGSSGDRFGASVSAGLNRVLIGAYSDDNGANQNVGSAYVFQENSDIWTLTFKLEASDQQAFDLFGRSVSLSGDRALIGAPFSDDSGSSAGSAYVFELDNGAWSEKQKLVASDASASKEFGFAVAMDGDNFVAGTPRDDVEFSNAGSGYGFNYDGSVWVENTKFYEALNINKYNFGDEVSIDGTRALIGFTPRSSMYDSFGGAYVFDYINGEWQFTTILKANDTEPGDGFGSSVSVLGDRALVGAQGVDSEFRDNSGAVYVFELQQNLWMQTAKLEPENPSTTVLFGGDVVLGNDRALIGTSDEYVSVFDYDGSTWNETVLTQNDTNNSINFGGSIGLDRDRIVVGAWRLDNGLGSESGGVYVFDFNGSWSQSALLRANDANTGDRFGFNLSVSGDSILVGAPHNDDNGSETGSAYIFGLSNNEWTQSVKLIPSDSQALDYFGRYVSLDDSRAIITGSDQVYVFDKGINLWSETEKISTPENEIIRSLDLKNDRVLIGTPFAGDIEESGEAHMYYVDPVYTVSGTISGLVNSIELQNMGANNITVSENGVFEFPNFDTGDEYLISILNQPQSPAQNCSITNAGGFVFNENITNIQIDCVSTEFKIGVNVSGLADSSSVQFSNNTDTLNVNENGTSYFSGFYNSNSQYNIITSIEPSMPNQICTVSNGLGTIANTDVVLNVECVTVQYQIGVTVLNLADGNTISLQNNGENLVVNDGNTTYFASSYDDLSHYNLGIITQPSTPNQTCNIVGPIGQINGENVNITVNCTYEQHRLSVIVVGLAQGNYVRLLNGEEVRYVDDSTKAFFTGTFDDGSNYNVTVQEQPSAPNQLCTVMNPEGNFMGEDVILNVNCVTNQYQLGMNVSGLAENNNLTISSGSESIEITNNGVTYFEDLLDDSSTYFIEVINQPTSPNQSCNIVVPGGTINGSDKILDVICTTDTFFVSGTVINLAQNNSISLSINTFSGSITVVDSTFVFPEPLADNTEFEVSIASQPKNPIQNCTLNNASGTINAADITNIEVICNEVDYFIGVTVTGLTNNNFMTLRNENNNNNLSVWFEGPYVFFETLADQESYNIIVSTQPSDPIQNCSVENGSGTINAQDVDDIIVTCEASSEVIFRQSFE